MSDLVYQRLRKEIDERMPVGMPADNTGADISILKNLFTPEEAAVAIHLSILPEKAERIRRRLAKNGLKTSIDEVRKILDTMVSKGAIMGGALFAKPGLYSLAQFAIGIYEFQVNRQTPDFARLAETYHESSLISEFFREDIPIQLRTVPVNRNVQSGHRVSTYDDIFRIAEKAAEPIVVMDCVCKETRDILADPCRLSDIRNTCMMFGDVARYYLERGIPSAKKISKKDLHLLLDKFREIGFVLQPANNRNPGFICACCGCCCNVLRGYKNLPNPSRFFASNYHAEINASLCSGCAKCLSRCQMDAIVVDDKKAAVDLSRCIGCGNCVMSCKKNAIVMREKSVKKRPPINSRFFYLKVLVKKKGISCLPGLAMKMLLGQKI